MADLKLLTREGVDAEASFALDRENLFLMLPRMDSLRSMVEDRRTARGVCGQLLLRSVKTAAADILLGFYISGGKQQKGGNCWKNVLWSLGLCALVMEAEPDSRTNHGTL